MTGNGGTELLCQVEALVAATRAERAALRRASITVTIVSVALIAIVGVFACMNYSQFKNEWTEEKLAAGFQRELEVLHPVAAQQIQEMGHHLMPVYAQAGRQEFLRLTPEIAARLQHEVDQLGANLRADANERLGSTLERVGRHTEEIVFAAFPGLTSESEQDKLTEQFHKMTETALTHAVDEFGHKFAKDVQLVEEHIHSFHADPSTESDIELQKRFLHLWLQLLDAEIMK